MKLLLAGILILCVPFTVVAQTTQEKLQEVLGDEGNTVKDPLTEKLNANSEIKTDEPKSPAKSKKAEGMAPAGEDKVLLDMGINLFISGDNPAALEKFKLLKSKYPQSPFVDQSNIWTAKTYAKLSDYKKAAESLALVQEKSGEYPAALLNAGQIYFLTKDYTKAKENFYKVSSMFPGHDLADDALISLAKIYSLQNEGNEAVETLVRVIKNYPDRDTVDDAYYLLGRIYEKDPMLKDVEKARSIYKKFIYKADVEKNPKFANSPLYERVKRELDYINKQYFMQGNK